MLPSLKKWLILPVEIKVRELDAKLWLASLALERSYGVIIGSIRQVERYEPQFPSGVYFAKDIAPGRREQLQRLNDSRMIVVCQDEETTIARGSYDNFFDQRVSEDSLGLTHRFFAWGSGDADCLKTIHPWASDRVVPTGSPRVDLWRPELRDFHAAAVKKLRKKYGDYILVASNFGANNISSDDEVLSTAKKVGVFRDPEAIDRHGRYWSYIRELFNEFKHAPSIVARSFPDLPIIVRPHPVEDPMVWRSAVSDVKNARVVFEGTITPWLLGARAVLHNSCTSAIEATILDVPVVSYRPLASEEFDLDLANAISWQATTPSELVDAVGAALSRPSAFLAEQQRKGRPLLSGLLTGLKEDLAAERILSRLDELPWNEAPVAHPEIVPWQSLAADSFNDQRITAKRWLRGDPMKRRKHKFPGLGLEELKDKLKRFRAVRGNAVAHRTVQLSKDLYVIWSG